MTIPLRVVSGLLQEAIGMFITYENTSSIEYKAAYIREMGLGGMMLWELSGDTQEESTSLLSTICRELSKNK